MAICNHQGMFYYDLTHLNGRAILTHSCPCITAAIVVALDSKAALGLTTPYNPMVAHATTNNGSGIAIGFGFWDCILCTGQGNRHRWLG